MYMYLTLNVSRSHCYNWQTFERDRVVLILDSDIYDYFKLFKYLISNNNNKALTHFCLYQTVLPFIYFFHSFTSINIHTYMCTGYHLRLVSKRWCLRVSQSAEEKLLYSTIIITRDSFHMQSDKRTYACERERRCVHMEKPGAMCHEEYRGYLRSSFVFPFL